MPLTESEGETLVRLARESIDRVVLGGQKNERNGRSRGRASSPSSPSFLDVTRGVFVTIKTSDGTLRGCIGFPYPVKRLGDAVQEAAVAAATQDPRFPRVTPSELDQILIEVSALTPPETIVCESRLDLPSRVRIGTDGLIVSAMGASGLLLPQVAVEYGLSPEDFLSQTSLKAGLMADAWLSPGSSVQSFQAEIFSEGTPRGRVERS